MSQSLAPECNEVKESVSQLSTIHACLIKLTDSTPCYEGDMIRAS